MKISDFKKRKKRFFLWFKVSCGFVWPPDVIYWTKSGCKVDDTVKSVLSVDLEILNESMSESFQIAWMVFKMRQESLMLPLTKKMLKSFRQAKYIKEKGKQEK